MGEIRKVTHLDVHQALLHVLLEPVLELHFEADRNTRKPSAGTQTERSTIIHSCFYLHPNRMHTSTHRGLAVLADRDAVEGHGLRLAGQGVLAQETNHT
jgi:hypothetical protein